MAIKIKLYGIFRIDRFKEEVCDYPSSATVREVVEKLGISDQLLGIVLINGVHAGVDDLLKDSDVLSLLPLLGGG